MTDNELKVMAKLLEPYRRQLNALSGGRPLFAAAPTTPPRSLAIAETTERLGYE